MSPYTPDISSHLRDFESAVEKQRDRDLWEGISRVEILRKETSIKDSENKDKTEIKKKDLRFGHRGEPTELHRIVQTLVLLVERL